MRDVEVTEVHDSTFRRGFDSHANPHLIEAHQKWRAKGKQMIDWCCIMTRRVCGELCLSLKLLGGLGQGIQAWEGEVWGGGNTLVGLGAVSFI